MHSLCLGASIQSQLVNSLKVYLNNKNRLQPIIGMSRQIPVLDVCVCARVCARVCMRMCVY